MTEGEHGDGGSGTVGLRRNGDGDRKLLQPRRRHLRLPLTLANMTQQLIERNKTPNMHGHAHGGKQSKARWWARGSTSTAR
jgi:phage major head subunit gpT-like protein